MRPRLSRSVLECERCRAALDRKWRGGSDARGLRLSFSRLERKRRSSGRTPKPGGLCRLLGRREAFWTAVPMHRDRFCHELAEAHDKVSPVVHFTRAVKAPEGWSSPRPGGLRRPLTADR